MKKQTQNITELTVKSQEQEVAEWSLEPRSVRFQSPPLSIYSVASFKSGELVSFIRNFHFFLHVLKIILQNQNWSIFFCFNKYLISHQQNKNILKYINWKVKQVHVEINNFKLLMCLFYLNGIKSNRAFWKTALFIELCCFSMSVSPDLPFTF